MYKVTEEFDEPYLSGPEYQLLDDKGPGERDPDQLTGSLYDMYAAPAVKKLNNIGDWNHSKIVVRGNSVEHWLNGDRLFTDEIGSASWNDRIANSKWKDATGFAKAKKGAIALQDHGSEVWFRKVRIRELK
jgi:hypothetical protein